MKLKILKSLSISFFTFLLISPCTAYPWGAATHTYFANELAHQYGISYQSEVIYGSMLPDMYNFMFGSEYKEYLWGESHYNFSKVDNQALTTRQHAYSFGFTSHNDDWGADYTAHHDGRTTSGEGYVISKVNVLMPVLIDEVQPVLINSGVSEIIATILTNQLAPSLTENFVETGIDLMIKRNEFPDVGNLMHVSANFEDKEVDSLLVRSYSDDFAEHFGLSNTVADSIIIDTEQNFRNEMLLYGDIFTNSESISIDMLSTYAVNLSESYLKEITGFDILIPNEVSAEFSGFMRDNVIPAIEDDYAAEISATLLYLEEQFQQNVVSVESEPRQESLFIFDNFPNPYNSSTTISYSLSDDMVISLNIYNSIGQKIDTPVNSFTMAGKHQIIWNASDLPTGFYFAVISNKYQRRSIKMLLLK